MEAFAAYGTIAFLLYCICNVLGIVLVGAGFAHNLTWLKRTGFFMIFMGTGTFVLFQYIY